MIGSIWATIHILSLPEIGGLANLISHENVVGRLSLFPDFSNPDAWIPILFIPLAVQWWASYYPGSEPGGGGYIAQRMFSAKDELGLLTIALNFSLLDANLATNSCLCIFLTTLDFFAIF